MGLQQLVKFMWDSKKYEDLYKNKINEIEDMITNWGDFCEKMSIDTFDVFAEDNDFSKSFGHFLVYGSNLIYPLQFPNRFGLRKKAGEKVYICDGLDQKKKEYIEYTDEGAKKVFELWKDRLDKLNNIDNNQFLPGLNLWMEDNKCCLLNVNEKEVDKYVKKYENIKKEEVIKRIKKVIEKDKSCFQPGVEWKLAVLQSVKSEKFNVPSKFKGIQKDYEKFVDAVEDMEEESLERKVLEREMIEWGNDNIVNKENEKEKIKDWEELKNKIEDSDLYKGAFVLELLYIWTEVSERNISNTFGLSFLLWDLGLTDKFEKIDGDKPVIYTGAPGTGKTFGIQSYVKMKCTENPLGVIHCREEDKDKDFATNRRGLKISQSKFVQFHSSYDYSDFVEGLRPVNLQGDNKPTFVRTDGIFMRFCRDVAEYNTKVIKGKFEAYKELSDAQINNALNAVLRGDKEKDDNDIKNMKKEIKNCSELKKYIPNFYFIIDEINRADLGNVFGELMYLLEKRGETIDTQYRNLDTYGNVLEEDKEKTDIIKKDVFENGFFIPPNVHIAGTMNDIDRSVETFDFALRRRFDWVEIDANDNFENTLKGMYRKETEVLRYTDKLVENAKNMNLVICGKDSKGTNGSKFGLNKSYQIGAAVFKGLEGRREGEDNKRLSENSSLQKVWKGKIEPTLREYVRGFNKEQIDEFVINCGKKLFDDIDFNNFAGEEKTAVVYCEDKDLDQLVKLIDQDKDNAIIFTGAPGTGKTYGVQEYVKKMTTGDESICKFINKRGDAISQYKFVQFHSSFDYSDFVEGLRPVKLEDTDEPTFVRMDGIFKSFCRDVAEYNEEKNDDKLFYFVIDEINRADLGKVFGELMYLIEKRGEMIDTQYMNLKTYAKKDNQIVPIEDEDNIFKDGFFIPKNIKIIGTMNDIDRSVESFDFALRRRFRWVEVNANETMESTLKGMKLKIDENTIISFSQNKTGTLINNIMDMNNVIGGEKGVQLGLNDSYQIGAALFKRMKVNARSNKVTENNLKVIWDENIEPTLREYVRGRNTESGNEFINSCKDELFKHS